ncbi:MAG: hypothetical protein ACRDYE_09385, partial [Acidimicrobiales bacterium]
LMPVILVIIIAVAWIAILAPNMMKRRTRLGDGISSISHFHQQLRVLEHSAPEPIVAPAYRLRTVDGDATGTARPDHADEVAAPVLTVVGADQLPRPALAFLGRDGDEPAPPASPPPAPALRVDGSARHVVRRRRRDTLSVLSAVFVTTLLIGFLPGARPAWVVGALTGAALVAYVALLVRLRRLADERGRKLHYLRDEGLASMVGRGMGGGTVLAGRLAHPSHQVWAAR